VCVGVCVWTHPQGLDDQVPGLQLSLHDAQQGEQLGLAQVIHVELTFLQHTHTKTHTHTQVSVSQCNHLVGLDVGVYCSKYTHTHTHTHSLTHTHTHTHALILKAKFVNNMHFPAQISPFATSVLNLNTSSSC